MSVKAIGIALKLTLSGMNQLVYPQTWAFTLVVIVCVITQMNYLNKVTNFTILLSSFPPLLVFSITVNIIVVLNLFLAFCLILYNNWCCFTACAVQTN